MILATISSDPTFHRDVRSALDGPLRFDSFWELRCEDVARLFGAKPDQRYLTVVDFQPGVQMLPVVQSLSARPHIIMIGVNCGDSRDELLQLMRAGVRDVLPAFNARGLTQASFRALALLSETGEVLGDIYAFLPGKPGCGATTVATHAAGLAAAHATQPTLLLDFDFRLGLTTFLLKAESTHCVLDALQHAHHLDRDLWSTMVAQIGNLHLLGSGAGDLFQSVSSTACRDLLDFAVRHYSLIAVDLPGTLEDYECDLLLRAKKIVLVTTADTSALYVARRKAEVFRELELTDKVVIALNSTGRPGPLAVRDIERLLQLPVRYVLPAGEKDISRAIDRGGILERSSSLGRQIALIADEMAAGRPTVERPNPVRRFVEYFSINPVRSARGSKPERRW